MLCKETFGLYSIISKVILLGRLVFWQAQWGQAPLRPLTTNAHVSVAVYYMSSELQFERLTKAAVAFLYTICAQSYSISLRRLNLMTIILRTHCYFDIEGVVILLVLLTSNTGG